MKTDRRTDGQTERTHGGLLAIMALVLVLGPSHLSVRPSVRLSAQSPDPKALIERSAKGYQSISSFRAGFRQVIADSMIGTFESKGKLVQAGESKLAMRFTDPAGEAIVMDG